MPRINIKKSTRLVVLISTAFLFIIWLLTIATQNIVFAAGESYKASATSDGTIVITGSGGAFNVRDTAIGNNIFFSPDFTRQSDGTYKSSQSYKVGVGSALGNSYTVYHDITLTIEDNGDIKVAANCRADTGAIQNCLGNISSSATLNLNGLTVEQVQAGSETSTGSDQEVVKSCLASGGVFGWIFCGILDLFDAIYGFFRGAVERVLFINDSNFDTTTQGGANLYASWSNVKNIANALIALSALVIIASQIFGFEILSAYTVKKALPRVLIAAIAIQLSWIIFTAMISLTNAIGIGIYDLLVWPFVQSPTNTNDISELVAGTGTSAEFGLGIVGAAIVGAAAVTATSSWLALALALAGAIIGILIAFVVLIIRSVVIVLLLALAPLAIAAWVLPGTQTWWKVWWQTFSKLLLMFPLIMALFAGGTIAANLVSNVNETNPMVNTIILIIVYFAPFFMVGATFKFAGNLFGKIVSIGDRAKGDANKFGWFGARDRAKFNKENSSWSQIQSNRKEALNRRTQVRNAKRIGGEGDYKGSWRSQFVQRGSSSWIDPEKKDAREDLTRAQARAGVQITKTEKENFENMAALADYRVTSEAKRLIDEDKTGELKKFDLFTVEQQVRAAMLSGQSDFESEKPIKNNLGQERKINLKGVQIDSSLNTDVALQALQMKDDTRALKDYIDDKYNDDKTNFTALKDRGTADRQAWSILVDKLPTAAKGNAVASLSNMTASGFGDGIKNYAALGKTQQSEIVDALRQGLKGNDQQRATASGYLQDIVRGPKIDQSHIDSIAKGISAIEVMDPEDPTKRIPVPNPDTNITQNFIQELSAARSVTSTVSSPAPGKFKVSGDRQTPQGTAATVTPPASRVVNTPPTATATTVDGKFYTEHPTPYIQDPNDPSKNIPNPDANWKETK